MTIMHSTYEELQVIYMRSIEMEGISPSDVSACVELLKKNGRKLRDKDGKPRRLTLSTPTSKEAVIVLGIRYEKRNNSFTEDTFYLKVMAELSSSIRGA
jgi:hypothetical protein